MGKCVRYEGCQFRPVCDFGVCDFDLAVKPDSEWDDEREADDE